MDKYKSMKTRTIKCSFLFTTLIMIYVAISIFTKPQAISAAVGYRRNPWHLMSNVRTRGNYQGDFNSSQSEVKSIAVEAMISSLGVIVKINDSEVYKQVNITVPWGERTARVHAGVHLIVLHQMSGHVMRKVHFLTWQPEIHKQLSQALNDIRDRRLFILLGSPEFTEFLSDEVQEQFESLGSQFIRGFTLYDQWCFIGWKGGDVIHETLTTAKVSNRIKGQLDVSPLHVHITVPLSKEEELCGWYSNAGMQERAAFCESYDGYGEFCACQEPPWNPDSRNPPEYSTVEEIPLAIVTSRRLPHVLRQVCQIRNGPGGRNTTITIFVDGHNPEAKDLGRVLGISLVEHNSAPSGSTMRVNEHIKFSLRKIFELHKKAKAAIILEDDLDLSPDFISYFHQIAPLLISDRKLLFANAFNYNSYPHTSTDPKKLYRAHGIPGYGWMTTRWGAQEMLRNWAGMNQSGVVWDWWIRSRMIGIWDMIIPEIPRTQHMGGGGVHISGYDQILFSVQPLNNVSRVQLDVKSVEKTEYDASLLRAIGEATVVTITDHPCEVIPLPNEKTQESYVIYLYQPDESRDHHSYYVLSLCLGINDRDSHESYNMMTTFPFYGNQVYLVFCPNSPFCQPQDPRVIYRGTEEDASYAKTNQYPRAVLKLSYALRMPPKDPEEEFNLQNRLVMKYDAQ